MNLFVCILAVVVVFSCLVIGLVIIRVYRNRGSKRITFTEPYYKIYFKDCFMYGLCNLTHIKADSSNIAFEWDSRYGQSFGKTGSANKVIVFEQINTGKIEGFYLAYAVEFLFIINERSVLYIPGEGRFIAIFDKNAKYF